MANVEVEHSIKNSLKPLTITQAFCFVKRDCLLPLNKYEPYYKTCVALFVLAQMYYCYLRGSNIDIVLTGRDCATLLMILISIIWINFISQKLFTKMYTKMYEVDMKLGLVNRPEGYVNMKRINFVIVILALVFHSTMQVVEHFFLPSGRTVIERIYNILILYAINVEIYIFIQLLRVISIRFSVLTDKLKTLAKKNETDEDNIICLHMVNNFVLDVPNHAVENDSVIADMSEASYKLLEVCSELTSAFSVQLFFLLAANLLYTLTGIDQILRFALNQETQNVAITYSLIIWWFFQLGIIYVVCFCAECIEIERIKFINTISKLLVTCHFHEEKRTILEETRQLLQSPAQITICGAFILDRKFIFSLISVAVTYAIVLVQFYNITLN